MIDSPARLAWRRFCAKSPGLWSLRIFLVLFALSLSAELISNDRPLVVSYQGDLYWPLVKDYSEKNFGGEFDSPADYLDHTSSRSYRPMATGPSTP